MNSIRNHPTLKNRINKYMNNLDEVKTWVDMESLKPDYDEMENSSSTYGLSNYYNKDNIIINSIITDRQLELEGLYCKDTKFYSYKSIHKDEYSSCHDLTWKCHKCGVCDDRRGLDIMIKIEGKFNDRPEVKKTHLQLILIRNASGQDLTPMKITKRMKYLGFTGLLLHSHDLINDRIGFLVDKRNNIDELGYELTTQQSITYGGALRMVRNNKYRFLGVFFKKAPTITIGGMTKEDIEEMEEQEHFKSDKCKCGDLWEDHVMKQRTRDEMINDVVPEDHYRIGHKKFLEQYFSYALDVQQKLEVDS